VISAKSSAAHEPGSWGLEASYTRVSGQRHRINWRHQPDEITPQWDAFAKLSQAILVECLYAQKHVGEADPLPELEHLLVSKQHVTARFQVEVAGR
jgi:hypothetical protein